MSSSRSNALHMLQLLNVLRNVILFSVFACFVEGIKSVRCACLCVCQLDRRPPPLLIRRSTCTVFCVSQKKPHSNPFSDLGMSGTIMLRVDTPSTQNTVRNIKSNLISDTVISCLKLLLATIKECLLGGMNGI